MSNERSPDGALRHFNSYATRNSGAVRARTSRAFQPKIFIIITFEKPFLSTFSFSHVDDGLFSRVAITSGQLCETSTTFVVRFMSPSSSFLQVSASK
jgi:hypothetical protein